MEQQTVRRLNDDIENAIAQVIEKRGLKRLPLLPSKRTMHRMAKAAVAVDGAVVDDHDPRSEGGSR